MMSEHEVDGRLNKRYIGTKYEQEAAKYLENRGYRILARNYRCRQGEIDLIAAHEGYLVFVEVKFRSDARKGYGSEAVDVRKQRRIIRCAAWYMGREQIPENTPCRFDVLSFLGEQPTLIQNAFEL